MSNMKTCSNEEQCKKCLLTVGFHNLVSQFWPFCLFLEVVLTYVPCCCQKLLINQHQILCHHYLDLLFHFRNKKKIIIIIENSKKFTACYPSKISSNRVCCDDFFRFGAGFDFVSFPYNSLKSKSQLLSFSPM